ncbi:hypothetical protein [Streptomyces silvensis]|uniref:Uncharacterized protein n=1 Tax=Streptomyces silvensis TaxID=1765722 RepID=A0A0W7X1W9_9ACTN|nr:hypothetical protein [Streptomyces silvensis]KUF16852.1 hypothetical protein AT728_23375 [Streptomyces silvensis]
MGNRADDKGTGVEIYREPLTGTVHGYTPTAAPEQLFTFAISRSPRLATALFRRYLRAAVVDSREHDHPFAGARPGTVPNEARRHKRPHPTPRRPMADPSTYPVRLAEDIASLIETLHEHLC